ncbi:MAG: LytTR family DNA-binding domain-containing protein [Tahibacter sp.]
MRALIVEDETIAAQTLREMLAEFAPELVLESSVASISGAIARLAQPPPPDLVFMDVRLSDGMCFEIFDALPAASPVIFTTAYDEFALQAFEAFGIDYLLKPIRPARLAAALSKWRQLIAQGRKPEPLPAAATRQYFHAAQQYRKRLLVQSGDTLISIPVADVAYFHKALIVRVVTNTGRAYPVSQSLDELEQTLDSAQFFRLNRQVLARAEAISQISRGFKGKLDIRLQPTLTETCTVSQERAAELREWLNR